MALHQNRDGMFYVFLSIQKDFAHKFIFHTEPKNKKNSFHFFFAFGHRFATMFNQFKQQFHEFLSCFQWYFVFSSFSLSIYSNKISLAIFLWRQLIDFLCDIWTALTCAKYLLYFNFVSQLISPIPFLPSFCFLVFGEKKSDIQVNSQ